MNKNKKVAMLSFVLIGAFMLSSFGNVAIIAPANGQIVTNFQLVVETNTGNRRRESFALYLKQVLAPFGIDVTVIGKPFNQFVGDLLHFTGATWDIAIVGFSGGSPFAPGFVDLYACDGGFFGVLTYQLCDPAWDAALNQSSTAQGHPLNQAMVDDLIYQIDQEFNMVQRKALTNTFQEWFMTQLLYDYPLLAPTGIVGIWAGFDGYDADEGIIGSAFTGGKWNYATHPNLANDRTNGADEVAYSIGSIDQNFDPLQGASTSQSAAKANLFPTLTMFDKSYVAHPNVAIQYELSPWAGAPVLNESSCSGDNIATCEDTGDIQVIENGHMQFKIRDDVYWVNTTGGPTKTAHKVQAEDFAFTFDLYRSPNMVINGQSSYQFVYDVQYDNAAGTVDLYIYKPTIDDQFFGSYQAVPKWLLGGDLHLENGSVFNALDETVGLNVTALFQNDNLSPVDSVEWNAFEKNPVQAGAYYVDFTDPTMNKDGEFLHKKANPFFWFPNEKDAPGGDFNLNTPGIESTYYFDYNGSNPTNDLTIHKIILPIVEDLTVDLSLFKSGEIDLNSPDFFGGSEIKKQESDSRWEVHNFVTSSTADLLMFNILNPDLAQYDVRRAIAHAVNKDELGAIVDNLREPQDSPVKLQFLDFYNDQWKIPYDPSAAATLLEGAGYTVVGIPTISTIVQTSEVTITDVNGTVITSTFETTYLSTEQTTSVATSTNTFTSVIQAGDSFLIFFSAFATVITALALKKKRKF